MEKKMRILYFAEYELAPRPDVNTLKQFAVVKRVDWRYRAIKDSTRFTFFKLVYRGIEGFFWVLKIFKEIYGFRADILVVRFANYCSLIGTIASKISGKKSIVRAVGSDLKVHSSSLIGRIVIILILKMASGIVCVSRDLESIAQEFGAKNTRYIPDAIDPSCYCETKLKNSDNELITVARLIPVKGIDCLIRAMQYLTDCTLVIIGDGPEKTKLESLTENLGLSNRVFFTGWINNRQNLSMHLKKAKIFVLPSLSEGTPQVIIEAMSHGLPIVATNVGGIPEILVDGINGFLVPPGNEKVLAEAIEKVLGDVKLQRKASIKNREIAQRFFLPKVAETTYNFFKEIYC